jgi:hypothetical protein
MADSAFEFLPCADLCRKRTTHPLFPFLGLAHGMLQSVSMNAGSSLAVLTGLLNSGIGGHDLPHLFPSAASKR